MQLLRKISRATMIGDTTPILEKVLADKTKVVPLYRVYGFATSIRNSKDILTGDAKKDARTEMHGPWQCLVGQFEAENLLTGEVSRSGQCFLPQFAIDMVAGQFSDDVERVKFAFEVGAKFDDGAPGKYSYSVAPLLEVSEDDPILAIAASLIKPKTLTDQTGTAPETAKAGKKG
jgi:hypothetical protein